MKVAASVTIRTATAIALILVLMGLAAYTRYCSTLARQPEDELHRPLELWEKSGESGGDVLRQKREQWDRDHPEQAEKGW